MRSARWLLILVLLLSGWRFTPFVGDGIGRTIGPFDNEQACNGVRDDFMLSRGRGSASKCWYYGGGDGKAEKGKLEVERPR